MHSSNREAREAYLREILFKNPKTSSRKANQLVKDKYGVGLKRSYLLEIKREYQMPKAPHITLPKPPKPPKEQPLSEIEKVARRKEREIAAHKKILLSEGFIPAEVPYLSKLSWRGVVLQSLRHDRQIELKEKQSLTKAKYETSIREIYRDVDCLTTRGLNVKKYYHTYKTDMLFGQPKTKEKSTAPTPIGSEQLKAQRKLIKSGLSARSAHDIISVKGQDKAFDPDNPKSPYWKEATDRYCDLKAKSTKRLLNKGYTLPEIQANEEMNMLRRGYKHPIQYIVDEYERLKLEKEKVGATIAKMFKEFKTRPDEFPIHKQYKITKK